MWGGGPWHTRPAIWAMSAMQYAPTPSAIYWNALKSMVRGYAEAPQTMHLRLFLLCHLFNCTVIEHLGFGIEAVLCHLVELPGKTDRGAMG